MLRGEEKLTRFKVPPPARSAEQEAEVFSRRSCGPIMMDLMVGRWGRGDALVAGLALPLHMVDSI